MAEFDTVLDRFLGGNRGAGRFASLQDALTTASGQPYVLRGDSAATEVSARVDVTGSVVADLSGTIIKQADGANLPILVKLAAGSGTTKDCRFDVFVDGNRDNNTTEVVGVQVSANNRARCRLDVGAVNCDIGLQVTGESERFAFSVSAADCGTALNITNPGDNTPDEIDGAVYAHDCDSFLVADGTDKVSGAVRVFGEVAYDWGAVIEQGWLDLLGELRTVGVNGGGGMLVDGANVRLTGRLAIMGGSATNCAYMLDVQAGYLFGLVVDMKDQFAAGVRLMMGATAGSAMLRVTGTPSSGPGIQLGDSGESDPITGFHVLPGSLTHGTADGTTAPALLLEKAVDCTVELDRVTGVIEIGSASYGNVVTVGRACVREGIVSFANNRTECDNVVLLRGVYSLTELGSVSGVFKGMRAEAVTDYNGAGGYYDGSSWAQG